MCPECQHSTETRLSCKVVKVTTSHLLFCCLPSFPFVFIPFGSAHGCLLPLVNQQVKLTELVKGMGKVSEENMHKQVLFGNRATLEQCRPYSIIVYSCRVSSPVLSCYCRIASSHIFTESLFPVHVLPHAPAHQGR